MNDDKREIIAPDRTKLALMYIVYLDGKAIFITETDDTPEGLLQSLLDGIEFPKKSGVTVKAAHLAPLSDLELCKLLMNLKGAIFNINQIAQAIRAGRSGLHIAAAGDVPR